MNTPAMLRPWNAKTLECQDTGALNPRELFILSFVCVVCLEIRRVLDNGGTR